MEVVPNSIETTTIVVVLLMNYNDNTRHTMTKLAITNKLL